MRKRVFIALLLTVATVAVSGCGKTINININDQRSKTEAKEEEPEEENADEVSADKVSALGEPEEASDEFLRSAADEAAPDIDISGCDTFTQIVDEKLSDGMGYANEKIADTDVLLVSSATYDNLDGNMAAIDAAVFIYKDGVPYEAGKVCSAGTAYPLAIKDGLLYASSGHWGLKYTLKNNQLVIAEKAAVEYDTEGNESYYYSSKDGSSEDAEAKFSEYFDELEAAEIIDFQPVGSDAGSSASSLPAYEYPGPELFYTVLYQYLIDELGPNYPEAQVGIPCPVIIAEDESDRDDIRVWGNFWYFNYDLNGDILENVSGGSYPGVIHIKSTDEGYEVTGMEVVEDGSRFDESAKKIFGEHYDEFIKAQGDDEGNEKIRAQIIANYVAANNLSITAYKDYGWDPVPLPEENIDNFYSIL